MSLLGFAEDIAQGYTSCREAVDQALSALRRLQPVINIAIDIQFDAARAAAEAADATLATGARRGRLHGVPLAHKDMFDRVGRRCTFGSRIPQTASAIATAPVIERLERAGAITIASLHMAEFALGPTGQNAIFGACRNPWDPRRISGGSSSGAAAAVAANIVAGALGSDTGGSIRVPASCCGVTGLKPTHGLVDCSLCMPLAPSLDCIGPLARSAEDCETLLALIVPNHAPMHVPTGLRLAFPRGMIAEQTTPDVCSALEAAAQTLLELGAELRDCPIPQVSVLHDLAETIQKTESAAVHLGGLQAHRMRYSRHIRRRIEAGLFIPGPVYVHALRQRVWHERCFVEATLRDVDALLLPALGFEVPLIDESEEGSDASLERIGELTRWTRWLSYLGVPALCLPCGFDRNGMPVGLQIVGRRFSDPLLLAIGRWFQQRTDWHRQIPVLVRPMTSQQATERE